MTPRSFWGTDFRMSRKLTEDHPSDHINLSNENKTNIHETPSSLYRKLFTEFKFDLDAAATATVTKCPLFISPQENALTMNWKKYVENNKGKTEDISIWLNPPYGPTKKLRKFIRKAVAEARKDEVTVVILTYFKAGANWYYEDLYPYLNEERRIKGRLTFEGSENNAPDYNVVGVIRDIDNNPPDSYYIDRDGERLDPFQTIQQTL